MSSIPKNILESEGREAQDVLCLLEDELVKSLTLYWNIANAILKKSGIQLKKPSEEYFSLENNFFSALFLYSYMRGDLPKSKRILYTSMNQCLRGMVTGCDNILDNEYKKTLDTDLPIKAKKFRSIIDIMVSDRILVAILHKGHQEGEFSFDHILKANTASLHALVTSGIQEATEEGGAGTILKPEEVLSKIHPLKTGILFQAPWVLPELMETKFSEHITKLKEALFKIGMGCQILDDMVDLAMDSQMNRHNYVASLIHHGKNIAEQKRLGKHSARNHYESVDPDFLLKFPDARKASAQEALIFLEKGTEILFDKNHKFLVPYSIKFLIKRIGAIRFLPDIIE
ncbi:MAG: hypothetical protein GY797_24675 [Deltaproteobacteria bacterium]|nr:hypothetical protein [Deltaproteobacteria bacterium]